MDVFLRTLQSPSSYVERVLVPPVDQMLPPLRPAISISVNTLAENSPPLYTYTAVLHGSTAMTNDAVIFPAKNTANIERLSAALSDLKARLRVDSDPNGIDFDPHPALIASMAMLNMATRCGDLDLTFAPAGLKSYDDVRANAVVYELAGQTVHVAALEDIIRSKESAGRPKDHATLPLLRALKDELDRRNQLQGCHSNLF